MKRREGDAYGGMGEWRKGGGGEEEEKNEEEHETSWEIHTHSYFRLNFEAENVLFNLKKEKNAVG